MQFSSLKRVIYETFKINDPQSRDILNDVIKLTTIVLSIMSMQIVTSTAILSNKHWFYYLIFSYIGITMYYLFVSRYLVIE